jgi:hypothetical protein
MTITTLKAQLCMAAACIIYDDRWKAVGTLCDLFSKVECLN